MKLLMLKRQLNKFEQQPITFLRWLILFSAIIIIRIFEEVILSLDEPQTINFFYHDFFHFFMIFLFISLASYYIFSKTLNLQFKQFLNISIIGLLFLSIIPPVINYFIALKYNLVDFYEFYSLKELVINFFTFMSQEPLMGVLPGQRIVIALALIVIGLYSFIKVNKWNLVAINVIFFYIIFYIVSTLPSIITVLIGGIDSSAVDVSTLILSPINIFNQSINSIDIALHKKMIFLYLIINGLIIILLLSKKFVFRELLKNIRPTQIIFHIGLLFTGILIATFFTDANFIVNFFNIIGLTIVIVIVLFGWFSSIIINDYFDESIDKISNKKRPLIVSLISKEDYLKLGTGLIVLSVILTTLISLKVTLLVIIYYSLTLIYNIPPIRLKKIPVIATFVAALASLVIIFIGYSLLSSTDDLSQFPLSVIYFVLIVLTISLPIKDLKDIQGDRENGIYTLSVIFGEKKSRLIIGFNIFSSFLLSVFIFGVQEIFWWALLFGIIIFLLMNGKINKKFILSTQRLIPAIFSVVFIYAIGFILTICNII